MRITDNYVLFFSYRDMFSNHFRCQNKFGLSKHKDKGVFFSTVEHFMMYEKAMLFGDTEIAEQIAREFSPQKAKMLGRKVKGFDNEVWGSQCMPIVQAGIISKLLHNEDILISALDLRRSGKSFVEASPFDSIWGIKMGEWEDGVTDPYQWKGENRLGKCWDSVTDMFLQSGKQRVKS